MKLLNLILVMLLLFLSFLITFGVGIFHHCKRKWYIHIISDACHVCQGPINVLPICEWSTLLVPEVFYSEAFGIQISCSALIGHFVQTTCTSIATPFFITVNLILQYNPLILWSFHWAHIQTTGMPLPIIREAYIIRGLYETSLIDENPPCLGGWGVKSKVS